MYCVLCILWCILWASGPEINVILSYLSIFIVSRIIVTDEALKITVGPILDTL